MSGLGVLGVYRERRFSPGKVEADRAVLDAALARAGELGARVSAVSAEALASVSERPERVLAMAQGEAALRVLEGWEAAGTRVVNRPFAVRNCYRVRLAGVLEASGAPTPRRRLMTLSEAAGGGVFFPGGGAVWLKRGDVHAMREGDVVRVETDEAAQAALLHFRRHGVEALCVEEHVPGPVVKFYGVGPGAFFAAFEAGSGARVREDLADLSEAAAVAALAAGLRVFGGDAVIAPGRGPVVVDLNDWPSFSPCRDEAAGEMARLVAGAGQCARPPFSAYEGNT